VVVNCAAMRADRLEVELFGSESLGDRADGPTKVGTLEQAHGGTLLLDEVADMPLETQGKIVRVLQEQTFERVGGATRVEVDVRVIASTNRDLAEEMQGGRFRQDLFYRLNVVPSACRACASAARISRCCSIISCAARRRSPGCRRAPSGRTRSPGCRPMTGPAMCASCAMSWTGC
jgi:Transcriptional regulator containing PAS, AAA-type ATPase, and DNA-binding domains